jgi:hypothetical protein
MIKSLEMLYGVYGPQFGLAEMGTGGRLRQHSLIRNIVGCDGGTDTGTRRLEDWVGKSLDEIDRGGRPRGQTSVGRSRAGQIY